MRASTFLLHRLFRQQVSLPCYAQKGLFLAPVMSLLCRDAEHDMGPHWGHRSRLWQLFFSAALLHQWFQRPVLHHQRCLSTCHQHGCKLLCLCPLSCSSSSSSPSVFISPPFSLLPAFLLAVKGCLPFPYNVWVSDFGLCPHMVLLLPPRDQSSCIQGQTI